MHNYAKEKGKKWLQTKKNIGRHLSWDIYKQLDHPNHDSYTKMKIDILLKPSLNFSPYTIFDETGMKKYEAFKKNL